MTRLSVKLIRQNPKSIYFISKFPTRSLLNRNGTVHCIKVVKMFCKFILFQRYALRIWYWKK